MEEGHTHVKLSPPGTMDVSKDHPTFDGNSDAFAVVDLDGDGYLTCTRGRAGDSNTGRHSDSKEALSNTSQASDDAS